MSSSRSLIANANYRRRRQQMDPTILERSYGCLLDPQHPLKDSNLLRSSKRPCARSSSASQNKDLSKHPAIAPQAVERLLTKEREENVNLTGGER